VSRDARDVSGHARDVSGHVVCEWHTLWVEMCVTLFVSDWGCACCQLAADALCLLNGHSVYVCVRYRTTSGYYNIVRWSHMQMILRHCLIDMITNLIQCFSSPQESPLQIEHRSVDPFSNAR